MFREININKIGDKFVITTELKGIQVEGSTIEEVFANFKKLQEDLKDRWSAECE